MATSMKLFLFTGTIVTLSTLWTSLSVEIFEEGHSVTVKDVVFLIRSQQSSVHAKRAEKSKERIESQCKQLNQAGCDVVLIHEKYQSIGSWILLPIFPSLENDFPKKKWLFFCEEETQVNVAGLLEVLKKYDTSKPLLLGKALVDQVPSIIHHYKFHEDVTKFKFPDFEAGWLINRKLLQIIARRWKEEPADINFSIDIKHEVAVFIWDEGNGSNLINVPELCSDGSPLPREYKKGKCVTQHHKEIAQCEESVPQEKVLFAVKTCQKFHKSRVKVVLNTWGQFADNVIYYSDVKDDSIPTVDVNIPNVERGHCSKTLEILKRFLEDEKQAKYLWLIIVDDDTILSVSRLMKLLSCYDPTEEIFLGERYGYGHGRMFGYDYITGGGGMVFSRQAVSSFIKKGLRCSKHDDPDDMIIGMYAKSFSIPVIHSPLFHQSQPQQYALGFLEHQTPVSFHKHTNLDPYEVYTIWFYADDESAARDEQNSIKTSKKEEL
ncbi:Beta-1,3-glucosyltransferase [Holothuria leucospilota]|uniref:Beta-1,3-glucosyltransferase n=1 Tax=Holothuria leucospilota TaxID=206669 RepID=A0A9Q1CGB9_HOLLE|nr:Beta-1,3-glucosyltransferase [Holothuria leucospilota]